MRPLLAAVAVLAALAGSAGCSSGTGGLVTGGDTVRGKELFTKGVQGKQSCASCHALADAGSQSTVGPNLDDAFAGVRKQGFGEEVIRDVVADQIKYAVPPMPKNLVEGSDADDVAAYVASVAGKQGYSDEIEAQGGGGGAGTTDGRSIFISAGCAGCHVLAAAGANGTVGPNLDEKKPSVQLAIERVTNGKGPMPSFKGRLSNDQIQAVAEFVAKNAGK